MNIPYEHTTIAPERTKADIEKLLCDHGIEDIQWTTYQGDTTLRFMWKLQEQKKIVFKANDNLTYKIENNGRVYRRVEKEWKLLCIIRPANLPLPDFLLAMFVNLREHPNKYPLRRR